MRILQSKVISFTLTKSIYIGGLGDEQQSEGKSKEILMWPIYLSSISS